MSGQRGDAMTFATKTQKNLLAENEELRLRLEEAEETLRAIGSGEVDAFVVSGPEGEQQVFTLKGAEQPYRILVESMNEGAATLTADGTILYCNKRLSAMLKIPLENLIGTNLGTYVEQHYHLTYTALLENCTQESQSEEIAMTTVAGNSIPVFVSCCSNDISGVLGISVVITDLTLQRRNEAILTSEQFTTSIIDQTSDAMFVCDTKGKIIRASQSAHKLCGTNPLLKSFNKIFRFRIKETGEKFSLSAHMRSGVYASIEVDFKRSDGRMFTLLLNATHHKSILKMDIGSIVTLTDITERKLTEEALHMSELRLQAAYGHLKIVNEELQIAGEELQAQGEELQNQNQELKELWARSKASEEALAAAHQQIQSIVDNTPAIVYAFDPEERFVLANSAIAKLLNSTPAQMIGKSRHDFMPRADADWHETNDRKVIEAGRALEFEEQSELQGRSITWLTTKFPLLDAAGKIYAVAGISTDISERKQAEEAIRKNEKTLSDIYASMSEGLALHEIVYDSFGKAVDYLIVEVNPAFESITGLERSTVIGKKASELYGTGEAPYLDRYAEVVLTGEPTSFEVHFVPMNKHFQISVFSPEKGSFATIFQDITERKQAEISLQESRNDLDRAQKVGKIGSWRLDVRSNSLTWSDENHRIFGIPKGTLLTYETFLSTIHPDDRQCVDSQWNAGLRGEQYDIEHRIIVEGEVKWVREKAFLDFDQNGSLIGGFGITQDITKRKLTEEALQQSEQRMQQALRVSRSFTFDWSPVTDQVIRSASCAAILKLTGDEAANDTGEHYFQCVHPEDRARLMQILRDLTPTANTYITEYRYVSKDCSEITLEETGQTTFDSTGKILRVVGVSTDISVRKQAEEGLRKIHAELELRVEERTSDLAKTVKILEEEILERQNAEKALYEETTERLKAVEILREKEQMLIQQSRQAAMGEMIGNIAHQWRQPLNTLGLYTQMLGIYYGKPTFTKEFLDDSIATSMGIIKHMSKTIDDFRDYFRPEREKSDFYAIKAIKNTLSLLEGSFHNPNITIEFIEHDNPVINGYQNEFLQVLLNILNNARDAIIEREIADGRIITTVSSENNCAVVTVADNAGGIPDEIISKVFDPYFTTKGPQVGTGIGLFMSKTIIEKNMGGRLTVRNTEAGAEFRIEVEHGTQY